MIYRVVSLYYLHLFLQLAAVSSSGMTVFPAFCHTTFHHALITCSNVSRAGYIA